MQQCDNESVFTLIGRTIETMVDCLGDQLPQLDPRFLFNREHVIETIDAYCVDRMYHRTGSGNDMADMRLGLGVLRKLFEQPERIGGLFDECIDNNQLVDAIRQLRMKLGCGIAEAKLIYLALSAMRDARRATEH